MIISNALLNEFLTNKFILKLTLKALKYNVMVL